MLLLGELVLVTGRSSPLKIGGVLSVPALVEVLGPHIHRSTVVIAVSLNLNLLILRGYCFDSRILARKFMLTVFFSLPIISQHVSFRGGVSRLPFYLDIVRTNLDLPGTVARRHAVAGLATLHIGGF